MRHSSTVVVAVCVLSGGWGLVRTSEAGEAALAIAPHVASGGGGFRMPMKADGWLDLPALLVPSDGTRRLGNNRAGFNDSRDRGSKIIFFDPVNGNNDTAGVYWWDGKQIVDSAGRSANPRNGKAYGTDPLEPDETAIQPFQQGVGMLRNAEADPRLRTNDRDCESVAGGYPDWYLYRRDRRHDTFDGGIVGGRSESEPMVMAAYGPPAEGRAIIAPARGKRVRFRGNERPVANPMSISTQGAKTLWLHMVYSGLDVLASWSGVGAQEAESFSGGPVTVFAEDCRWACDGGGRLSYMARKTWMHRCVIAFSWREEAHNQGYYTSGFSNAVTFDEVIFYRNGYKSDPKRDPDPRRDIFSRNIYEGGGAQMGHQYLGIISADGASGGPQMRLGGRIEGSLIIEGYWFSSTNSNNTVNPWLVAGGQTGRSALVRNNVQLVFGFPTPSDPDTASHKSDNRASPAAGYTLQGASFGALVEGNIISQAMLIDDLGVADGVRGFGIDLTNKPDTYQDGKVYCQRSNTIRGNIVYRTGSGLQITGDWSGVKGNVVEGNVFVARRPIRYNASSVETGAGLALRKNRFYSDDGLPPQAPDAEGNTVHPYAQAAASERWPDPNRTLKRYVTEVLGLSLLDWGDDPFLEPAARETRIAAGESYDPTGMKTFMAVATNMRRGGAQAIPKSGKPSWTGDYVWDARLTGRAVVNWIRAGFGLSPAMGGSD